MKKQRPILMSTLMVLATLDNKKWQTRRVLNPQPIERTHRKYIMPDNSPKKWHDCDDVLTLCPFGLIGDILWVREEHYRYGWWEKNGYTATGRQKWKFVPSTAIIYFSNTLPENTIIKPNSYRRQGWYKRLGRFIPKSAARIWLEITDIRVERVQDISDEDAKAEGASDSLKFEDMQLLKGLGDWIIPSPFGHYQFGFMALWCRINGCESWLANQYVWVVSFKVVSKIGKPQNL